MVSSEANEFVGFDVLSGNHFPLPNREPLNAIELHLHTAIRYQTECQAQEASRHSLYFEGRLEIAFQRLRLNQPSFFSKQHHACKCSLRL